ncbi:peptidyl-prolyl cis-trans isomerase [Bacillus horti]|uniref:peptidylprolyl isomerase n=1 Tax=Caldalkalibacillus horti TaxID=77523 RepID=A0ABT9W2Y8_9BACI|nr:peptidyl-prolyl cis-trans isomerase [Bacillus horti]MDQ0167606.1 foldase protein PrsA [Bacillus horti]
MSKVRPLWAVIFILILLQAGTLFYFLSDFGTTVPVVDQQLSPSDEVNPDNEVEEPVTSDKVVAMFAGESITMEDLVTRLIDRYGEQTLDELINRKLIAQKAQSLGLEVDEEEIDLELEALRLGYSSEEEFYQDLESQIGISSAELRAELEYYMLLEEMATMDIAITEQQIQDFYEEHGYLFEIPTQYRVHQIAVKTEQEAQQALNEISGGSSFEAVAAERSIDLASSSAGGDMGFVAEDDFYIEESVLQALEALELDVLSEPIETSEGFVIVKVTEKKEGSKQKLENVSAKIRRQLALQQIDGVEEFLERLREQVGIEKSLP